MFTISDAQINAWLAQFLWPFFRLLAAMSVDPFLSSGGIPVRIRVGLAMFITILIANSIPAMPAVPPVSAIGVLIIMEQIVIGAALGFVMRIVFTAVEMAGNIAGLQMGLGFASFFDPEHGANTAVVAQFASLMTLLLFLSMNGHLVVLHTLVTSFHVLPISITPMRAVALKTLLDWSGLIFSLGMMMALPVLAALLVTNISIGVMSRAAPQFNVFAVGFPLTMSIGFAALYYAIPEFGSYVHGLVEQGAQLGQGMLRIMAGQVPGP